MLNLHFFVSFFLTSVCNQQAFSFVCDMISSPERDVFLQWQKEIGLHNKSLFTQCTLLSKIDFFKIFEQIREVKEPTGLCLINNAPISVLTLEQMCDDIISEHFQAWLHEQDIPNNDSAAKLFMLAYLVLVLLIVSATKSIFSCCIK